MVVIITRGELLLRSKNGCLERSLHGEVESYSLLEELQSDCYDASIIITSRKTKIVTLDSCPDVLDTVISNEVGLGLARNRGAQRAKGDLLIFLDDDLVVDPKLWSYVLDIKEGEFGMTFLSGFPCTRVLAIHKADFWGIGGFDEAIRFTGEDRDFFVRAVDAGLKFKWIPMNLVKHQPHAVRAKNIHVAIQMVKENMIFLRKYWRQHPDIFKVDFLDRFRRGQFRTLLLEVFWLLYLIVLGERRSMKEETTLSNSSEINKVKE